MGKVIFDMSMSLDGFVKATGSTPEEHLVPMLFGGGDRLFDRIGDDHIRLEVVSVVDTPAATHLRYRIVR